MNERLEGYDVKSSFDLVTGGAGFIGSHLCRGLLEKGRSVRAFDNLVNGNVKNLKGLAEEFPGRFEFHQGDIRDQAALDTVLEGCANVFHLAALPSVQQSVEDPIECNNVNVDGTLALFVAAKRAGVRKIVQSSSCAVYGDSLDLPKRETMQVAPMSPYAASKCCDELYGAVYSRIYDLPVVNLRYFNVFGPRQDPKSDYAAVIPRFITRMINGQQPIIFGDGEQSRDFVYVGNVVQANMMAAESQASGVTLNIGCGEERSLNQLVELLNEIIGCNLSPDYQPARIGDIRASVGDISEARKQIGFEPAVSVFEGLKRSVEWFQQVRKG